MSKSEVQTALRRGDSIPMADKPPMTFRESYSTVNGVMFTLQPERGVHTASDIAAAKRWLRNERDVIGILVEWQS